MIHEVDEAIRSLIREEVAGGNGVEVVFDAPTREWAARRSAPTLDCYLYDLREDLRMRQVGTLVRRGDDGRVEERFPPPRWFRLSYLVTAWTQRPEDEHRLLSAVLGCFAGRDALGPESFDGSIRELGLPVQIQVCRPPEGDRQVPEVWSALGGELKPSVDLALTAPLLPERAVLAAKPVLEPLILVAADAGAAGSPERERRQGRGRRHDGAGPVDAERVRRRR